MVIAITTKYVCKACGWKATKKTSDAISMGDLLYKCPTCDAPLAEGGTSKAEKVFGDSDGSTVYFDKRKF